MMLLSLNAALPRYFIAHYQGARELGIFSALSTVQAAGLLVVMALGNAALPKLARSCAHGNWPEFRNLVLKLLAITGVIGGGTVLCIAAGGDMIIRAVFGSQYAGRNPVFIWLGAAAAVSYCCSILGYAATAAGRIRFQPFAFGAVTLVTMVACAATIPASGSMGAAKALFLAAVVSCALYTINFAGSARAIRKRPAGTIAALHPAHQ
jgi:O-antigen/teichoic acid export membrane protein